MNVHHTILASGLCLVAAASIAAEPATSTQSLTRAQVRQATLEAKARGELHPGDDVKYPATPATPPAKSPAWAKSKHSSKSTSAKQTDAKL